jgi:hypothetical protein
MEKTLDLKPGDVLISQRNVGNLWRELYEYKVVKVESQGDVISQVWLETDSATLAYVFSDKIDPDFKKVVETTYGPVTEREHFLNLRKPWNLLIDRSPASWDKILLNPNSIKLEYLRKALNDLYHFTSEIRHAILAECKLEKVSSSHSSSNYNDEDTVICYETCERCSARRQCEGSSGMGFGIGKPNWSSWSL